MPEFSHHALAMSASSIAVGIGSRRSWRADLKSRGHRVPSPRRHAMPYGMFHFPFIDMRA
jgi:hypothetical protein